MSELSDISIEFMAKKDNQFGWDILCVHCDKDKFEKNIIQKYGYKEYKIVNTFKNEAKLEEGFCPNPWWFAISAHKRNCIYSNDLKKC